MKIIIKKLYYLHQLFKLEDLFVGALSVLIAAAFAFGGLPDSDFDKLFVAMCFCVLGLASINSLNQVFDVEIDRVNKPDRPIPSNRLTKKQVFTISFSLSLCAGLLTIYLGLEYFIIALIGLLIGFIYCLPQIYAKGSPILSSAVTAVGYGMLMFIVGWGVYKPILTVPVWILLFLYLHEVGGGLAKDFADVKGDKKEGVKTIPVLFGKRRGAEICYLLYLIPFILLLLLQVFNYLSTNFILLFISGLIFGLLIFGFSSFDEKKYNYLGYFFWVVGAVVIRLILFDAYIHLN